MTASKLRLACIGLLSVLAASSAWSAPVDRTIQVDCDHGGSLQAALRRAGSGPARIRVFGTCVGPFETAGDGIEIIGRSPAESRLLTRVVGTQIPALVVKGPGGLTLRNLSISNSGWGLVVEGPGRFVSVEGCELTENFYGLHVLSGATVQVLDSRVRSNIFEGISGLDAVVRMSGGEVSDNRNGVALGGRSTLDLRDVEVRGNKDRGVYAQSLSTVTATGTTFLDNGYAHASVADRSLLTVQDSTVGQPGDATASSLGAAFNSQVTIAFQTPGIVYGTAYAVAGSYLHLQGGTLHDRMELQDFSRAKVFDAKVEGTITCFSGSDVSCAGSATVIVSGCGPVSSSCNGAAVPAPELPAFLKPIPEGEMTPQRR